MFATESAVYRTSKDVEDLINSLEEEGKSHGEANIGGVAEYEPECAMLKVYGSESLDYIVDEMVQIYGGMGFSSEAPADRSYRDSRINRIFEGTNEINRLITVDSTIKKGKKHKIDLFEAANEVVENLDKLKPVETAGKDYYEIKHAFASNLKKAILMLLPVVSDTFKRQLGEEEEILMNISDMIMSVYVFESTLLRVEKLEKEGFKKDIKVYRDILDVLTRDTLQKTYSNAFDAIGSFAEGELKEKLSNALRALTKADPTNVKESRRSIANKLNEDGVYKF